MFCFLPLFSCFSLSLCLSMFAFTHARTSTYARHDKYSYCAIVQFMNLMHGDISSLKHAHTLHIRNIFIHFVHWICVYAQTLGGKDWFVCAEVCVMGLLAWLVVGTQARLLASICSTTTTKLQKNWHHIEALWRFLLGCILFRAVIFGFCIFALFRFRSVRFVCIIFIWEMPFNDSFFLSLSLPSRTHAHACICVLRFAMRDSRICQVWFILTGLPGACVCVREYVCAVPGADWHTVSGRIWIIEPPNGQPPASVSVCVSGWDFGGPIKPIAPHTRPIDWEVFTVIWFLFAALSLPLTLPLLRTDILSILLCDLIAVPAWLYFTSAVDRFPFLNSPVWK